MLIKSKKPKVLPKKPSIKIVPKMIFVPKKDINSRIIPFQDMASYVTAKIVNPSLPWRIPLLEQGCIGLTWQGKWLYKIPLLLIYAAPRRWGNICWAALVMSIILYFKHF